MIVMATDRSTLAASLVTCACPKPNPLFNSLKQSRQAQHKDWQSLLLPLGLVVLFVLLLIALAQLS